MKICKEALSEGAAAADEKELTLINLQSRHPLKGEEVYTFAVRLCDNEVDRDFERFDLPALEKLAELFVGRSGIFDHNWSAGGQTARIYRTELVNEEGVFTSAGEPYTCLKGYAYMIRTDSNQDLIREIEGGIKKEVSVSCAVADTRCSICGESLNDREKCVHTKGRTYGGQLCCGILTEPTDAYEWSFVAVPAQRKAGVVKGIVRPGSGTLKEFLSPRADLLEQVSVMEKEAELGRRYLKELRREIVRLGGLLHPGMDKGLRQTVADSLSPEALLELKKSYEAQVEEKYPPLPQFTYHRARQGSDENDGAFLI